MCNNNSSPYVVSADLGGLFNRWGKRRGIRMPSNKYFYDFSMELRDNLANATSSPVEVIDELELREGLMSLVADATYPVISLDRAYINKNDPNIVGFIDITRAVNESHQDIGIHARPGFPNIYKQIQTLYTNDENPITLVDDVIFSGEGVIDLSQMLASVNRPVLKVIAGVGIDEGVRKLEEAGIEVNCVRRYESVVDEVCERDFIAGAPMSGRTVICSEGMHWSAPYFEPFGDSRSWASIPTEQSAYFSRFCLMSSIMIWHAIQQSSGHAIPANTIPRRIKIIDSDESVSSSLQRHL